MRNEQETRQSGSLTCHFLDYLRVEDGIVEWLTFFTRTVGTLSKEGRAGYTQLRIRWSVSVLLVLQYATWYTGSSSYLTTWYNASRIRNTFSRRVSIYRATGGIPGT